jgi:hypothetical protein
MLLELVRLVVVEGVERKPGCEVVNHA